MAEAKELSSVSRAFAQVSRRLWLGVAIGATVFLALFNDRILHWHAGRSAVSQARLCAGALQPGLGGDLRDSFQRLRSGYKGLAAVAALDVEGNVAKVYADDTAYAEIIGGALRAGTDVVALTVRAGDRAFGAWLVTVPLNGSASSAARRIAVLLRADSYTVGWSASVFILAAAAVVTALVCSQRLIDWFERRVAAPLRAFSSASATGQSGWGSSLSLTASGWHELERIAENMRALVVQGHQVERESQQRMDKYRRGFARQLRRAEDLATRDPLTGLFNRAHLDSQIETLFARHRQRGGDLAVVMIDLDNFKHHNDTCGHKEGDALLRSVGDLLRASVRPTDCAARFGGDEFVLLLPEASRDQAVRITERVLKLFGQYAGASSGKKLMSMSAGVASLKADRPRNGAELLERADAALYRAKRDGKNCVATSVAA